MTRDQFKNRKGTENEILRFQINMQMRSHDQIIFHMLFGAFHITLRKWDFENSHVTSSHVICFEPNNRSGGTITF